MKTATHLPASPNAARSVVDDIGNLVFHFYPVTAVMIVILGITQRWLQILSIAYDVAFIIAISLESMGICA